jgi:hypothetical protein
VRLAAYTNPDVDAGKQQLAQAASLQHELWTQALMASRAPDATPDGGRLLLPALNTLIETTTKQTMATEMHPPMIGPGYAGCLDAGQFTVGGSEPGPGHAAQLDSGFVLLPPSCPSPLCHSRSRSFLGWAGSDWTTDPW